MSSGDDSAADEAGWANLGVIGSKIDNQAPEFDARNYGYKKLGELVDASPVLERLAEVQLNIVAKRVLGLPDAK